MSDKREATTTAKGYLSGSGSRIMRSRSEQSTDRAEKKRKQKSYDSKIASLVFPAGFRSEQLAAIWVHLAKLGTASGL